MTNVVIYTSKSYCFLFIETGNTFDCMDFVFLSCTSSSDYMNIPLLNIKILLTLVDRNIFAVC